MSNLLAIDPGLTTGWAYIEWSPTVLFRTGNIGHIVLPAGLRKLRSKFNPKIVVIEKLPPSLTPEMRRVQETCHLIFPEHEEIFPAQWKPITGQMPVPARNSRPWTYTAHERDAYRMAHFYLRINPEVYRASAS